jgi:hypothetical protein
MKFIAKQFKQILLTMALLLLVVTVIPQVRPRPRANKLTVAKPVSSQLKQFNHLAAAANVRFVFPAGFREIPVINNEEFSFDYAMETAGRDFEVWLQVKSQKENYADYLRLKNDPGKQIENPDSLFISIGQAQAATLAGDRNYLVRTIPPDILARYNANAGKTYLLTLPDLRETKHYKYALLMILQKDHIGTIEAVCFTNEKSPEFFKNINRMSKYIGFK